MPYDNEFRHQTYHAGPPTAPYELVVPGVPVPLETAEFSAQLARAGRELRAANVAAIVLVHGTFTGNDVTGWISQLEWLAPGMADRLRSQEKRLIDALTGDIANYTDKFAETLRQGINRTAGDNPIIVRRFQWSSQNHHLGRADAAVRLFAELTTLPIPAGQRALVWGHSHAGNVLALLTHLIGSSLEVCQGFARAIRKLYYQSRGGNHHPTWETVASALNHDPVRLTPPDIATFGTPVRYGWETRGYRKLIHFIHHRPTADAPRHRAMFPPNWEQVLAGGGGDFLQQFAVAGTNFPVNIFSVRDWTVEGRLQHLLQPSIRRRDTWQRLKYGMRVPNEGYSLLVDYHEADSASASLLLGHGVYTRMVWLPFHLEQILRQISDPAPHA
jgi:hypothetical protein